MVASWNFQKYPMLQFVRVWRHVLEPGDVAYLPAGTYHSVKNLESCLSYHRFHLDEVNLPLFFNSLYAGDAPEIDHHEVIWNSIHGIFNDLENLEDIDMNRNKLNSSNFANDDALKIVEKRLSKLRLLLIRLRQICCAIYDQEHKKSGETLWKISIQFYAVVRTVNTPVMNQEVRARISFGKYNTECGECKVSKFSLCYIKR